MVCSHRRPIGVAVVGAGYWGANLVRNARSLTELRLLWLCDLDEERARRVAGPYSQVRVTADFDAVLDDPEVEAVIIATPAATHVPLGMRAIEAGKHLLVEKPLATNRRDAERLVIAAESAGLTLMCDHTYCYTPAVQKMHQLVAEGMLGDIQYIDSVRINLGLIQPDIDVLWDLAPHDLSVLYYLLPPEYRLLGVSAHGADPIGAGRACIAYLTLQISGGVIAHMHVNWLSPTKIRLTTLGGSKRMLVWDDLNPGQRVTLYDRGVDLYQAAELKTEQRREALVSYRSGDMVAPALQEKEALATMLQEFAASIVEDRSPATDGYAGLRVVRVLEAASESLARDGAMVSLGGAREPDSTLFDLGA